MASDPVNPPDEDDEEADESESSTDEDSGAESGDSTESDAGDESSEEESGEDESGEETSEETEPAPEEEEEEEPEEEEPEEEAEEEEAEEPAESEEAGEESEEAEEEEQDEEEEEEAAPAEAAEDEAAGVEEEHPQDEEGAGEETAPAPSDEEVQEPRVLETLDRASDEADGEAGDGEVGECVEPCHAGGNLLGFPATKPTKTVTAKIISVTFQNDHRDSAGKKLLKRSKVEPVVVTWKTGATSTSIRNVNSEVGDTFDEFLKPEWDVARGGSADSHPVSYTKNKRVVVDVVVEFTVKPGGSASLTQIVGTSAYFLNFDTALSQQVSTGPVTLRGLQSKDVLPNYVWWDDSTIEWSVIVDGKPVNLGSTGTHRLYVTFDEPIGKMESTVPNSFTETGSDQIVTEKRLEFSVQAAQTTGVSDEQECVDAIFKKLITLNVNYVLYRRWLPPGQPDWTAVSPRPTLHHYLWLCTIAQGQGECHNIAAAFALACRILGVKGSFEVGYMYPWAGRADVHPGYPRPNWKSAAGRSILGKYNWQFTRTHSGQAHQAEHLMFLDSNGEANHYEGVACYKGKALYAIGDDVFDSQADPHDNASLYFLTRNMSGGIRRAITSQTVGFFQLIFVDSANYTHCSQPYPWLARRRLSSDSSSPLYNKGDMWFKWEE